MTPEEFKKFKALVTELPTVWPEWEDHFSNMDINIPGHTEKADF